MKRIIVYGLLLVGVLLAPVEKLDVAKLRPIEVIYIAQEKETVILQTDTDDVGMGNDALSALENMKKTSPAVIYLDTAQYLLIGPDGEEAAQQLQQVLKDNIRLCKTQEQVDLKSVAKYLPVHGELPKFSQWKSGEKMPELRLENDRLKIS